MQRPAAVDATTAIPYGRRSAAALTSKMTAVPARERTVDEKEAEPTPVWTSRYVTSRSSASPTSTMSPGNPEKYAYSVHRRPPASPRTMRQAPVRLEPQMPDAQSSLLTTVTATMNDCGG